MIRELAQALAVAVLPAIATQNGEGVREAIAARRDLDKPCDHGFAGGRLCATCAEQRDRDDT